jgi:hypothetical protein
MPVANFLLQTWFLWLGFYNFYLGMVLMAFPLGFDFRHAGALGLRRAAALAAGLVVLFFTHIIPAVIAVMTVVTVALWINVAVPVATGSRTWPRFRELGILLASALLYLRSGAPASFTPQIAWAWNEFPMHVFQTGAGKIRWADASLVVLPVLHRRRISPHEEARMDVGPRRPRRRGAAHIPRLPADA